MSQLLSRQKWIPGGFFFYQPEIKWRSPRNVSFDILVNALIRARKANPAMKAKHNWSTDYETVANEVDIFNAKVCEANGWTDYITQSPSGSIPKRSPHSHATVLRNLRDVAVASKELVRGAKTLMEWIDSGEGAVPPTESYRRAEICGACPKNEPGGFQRWFTVPAAELIKDQISKAQARKLTTPSDEKLNLCTACHCPLKLKVHVPIQWIVRRLSPDQKEKLKTAPACWIVAEAGL